MLNDLCVTYVPIEYHKRAGKSKVRPLRDSLRALQIIVEAILRINPVKVFLLLALPFAMLALALAVVGLVTQSVLWGLASISSLCTSGLILGLGFLAVAMKPDRRQFPVRPVEDLVQTAAPDEVVS
jgi:hypothetical protein